MVECLEVAQCTPALVGKVNYFLHFQMKDDLLLSVGECEEWRKEAGAALIEGSKAIQSHVKCNQNCEPGLLHTSEIAQLQLSAWLMVLSACQTGQGEVEPSFGHMCHVQSSHCGRLMMRQQGCSWNSFT